MNILFFNSQRGTDLYGVERWMLNLGRALRRRGHGVGLAAWPQSAMLAAGQAAGLTSTGLSFSGGWDLGAAGRLRACLRRQAVDAVCVYSFLELRLARLAALGRPIRLLMRRGSFGEVPRHGLNRWTLQASGAHIVTGSQALQADFCAGGWLAPGRVHVLPHGVEADDHLRITPATGLPPTAVRVVYAGRLHPVKGTDVLLRAWPQVLCAAPQARLLLVGDGDRAACVRLAAELGVAAACDFAGYAADIKPWLAAADCFVLPSRQEGASYALLQAQAAGLPVVATRTGGNPELLRAGATGLLVPPENPAALAEALLELIAQPDRRRAMGAAARRFVAEHFSMEAAVRHFVALAQG